MLPHPKICILPWISMETTPTGSMRPCCLATDEVTNFGKVLTVKDGLSVGYHSDSMQLLRQEFLRGEKPTTCNRCWSEEDAGRTSKRQWHLRKFAGMTAKVNWYNPEPDSLWFLDLKLGNICNLKCRICGTWSSSKWAQEEMDYQTIDDPKTTRAYLQLKQGEWPRKSDTFWSDLETLLPQVKYFEFTGGEPFLIKEHFDLLSRAVELGYSKDISIHYNTNGTTWPEVEVWKHFKEVEIAFSVDNVKQRFEIERSGASWSQLMATLDHARDLRSISHNIKLQVCITINIQNILYLEEWCEWADTQGFNMVYFNMLHDPPHMNIGRMTETAQQLVINKLRAGNFNNRYQTEINSVIRFIENGTGSDGTEFCEFMKRTDANRKENFALTHTAIAEAMGYGQA
jgi:MoaA/NifB/PqqE/SkfB family radical SAM enzyme